MWLIQVSKVPCSKAWDSDFCQEVLSKPPLTEVAQILNASTATAILNTHQFTIYEYFSFWREGECLQVKHHL